METRRPKGSAPTRPHSLRCEDEVWERAKRRAARSNVSMNFVLGKMLDAYGKGRIRLVDRHAEACMEDVA